MNRRRFLLPKDAVFPNNNSEYAECSKSFRILAVIHGSLSFSKALTGVFSVAHQSDIARMGACVGCVPLR